MAYVSIDVDIDDVLFNMSSREKQQLVDDLYEDGYVPTKVEKEEASSITEGFYLDAIDKLRKNYHQLTSKEEQTIINISKRF